MNNASPYPLTLLYDGACPLCVLEIETLKGRNTAGKLAFVDISSASFDAQPFTRVDAATQRELMARIHAMRPDGSLLSGTEVFRLAYAAVGWGTLAAPTGWPVLKPLFELAYTLFARYRGPISWATSPLTTRLIAWQAARRARACHDDKCER
jgi:predicted DCC family thiol-disulfide oxidoreductase YuxK